MPTVILFLSFIFFFPTTDAYTFATKDQDCSKCHHILKKDEATAFLKSFDQNIKVLDVKKSPVKYLWEVSFESKGQKGMVYIDLSKKHIISGSLITIQGKKNLTQDLVIHGPDHLVARDQWKLRVGQVAIHHVQIGAADAAGPDPDQHLARPRLGHGHLGEAERGAHALEEHGPHHGGQAVRDGVTRTHRRVRLGHGVRDTRGGPEEMR